MLAITYVQPQKKKDPNSYGLINNVHVWVSCRPEVVVTEKYTDGIF